MEEAAFFGIQIAIEKLHSINDDTISAALRKASIDRQQEIFKKHLSQLEYYADVVLHSFISKAQGGQPLLSPFFLSLTSNLQLEKWKSIGRPYDIVLDVGLDELYFLGNEELTYLQNIPLQLYLKYIHDTTVSSPQIETIKFHQYTEVREFLVQGGKRITEHKVLYNSRRWKRPRGYSNVVESLTYTNFREEVAFQYIYFKWKGSIALKDIYTYTDPQLA